MQVVLTRTNLPDDVRLTVSDLPTGVTGAFTMSVLPVTSLASTLVLAVDRTARPGSYTAIITASANRVNAQALPVTITITRAPEIVLTPKPDSISVIAGGSGTITLDIARFSFAGPVVFDTDGAPAGVRITFPDAPATGSLATAVISAGPDVLPGVYVLQLLAIGQGIPEASAALRLRVLSPSVASLGIVLTPARVTARPDAPGTAVVTIQRRNFTGDVTLSAAGLPEGVVAVVAPMVTTSASAMLTLFVSPSTPPGFHPLTVTASADGVPSFSTNLDLVVAGAPSLAAIAVPESVTVQAGSGSGTGSLRLTRTNLTAPVTLSVLSAPAEVSVTFGENPTTGDTVSVGFTASASAVPGTYLVTIRLAAAGVAPVDVTFTLTVLPAG